MELLIWRAVAGRLSFAPSCTHPGSRKKIQRKIKKTKSHFPNVKYEIVHVVIIFHRLIVFTFLILMKILFNLFEIIIPEEQYYIIIWLPLNIKTLKILYCAVILNIQHTLINYIVLCAIRPSECFLRRFCNFHVLSLICIFS